MQTLAYEGRRGDGVVALQENLVQESRVQSRGMLRGIPVPAGVAQEPA